MFAGVVYGTPIVLPGKDEPRCTDFDYHDGSLGGGYDVMVAAIVVLALGMLAVAAAT